MTESNIGNCNKKIRSWVYLTLSQNGKYKTPMNKFAWYGAGAEYAAFVYVDCYLLLYKGKHSNGITFTNRLV